MIEYYIMQLNIDDDIILYLSYLQFLLPTLTHEIPPMKEKIVNEFILIWKSLGYLYWRCSKCIFGSE